MNPIHFLFKPEQLHIPDGFLSIGVALVFWALTILFVSLAIRNTRGELGERQIPLMGVMAAFIWASCSGSSAAASPARPVRCPSASPAR